MITKEKSSIAIELYVNSSTLEDQAVGCRMLIFESLSELPWTPDIPESCSLEKSIEN